MVDDAPKQDTCCADTPALERAIADAQQKLSQLQDIQRAARVQMILLVCVIIVIMLVFGTKIYTTVRANFSREQMTQQLMDRLPGMVDIASRRLTVAIREAAPVYAKLAQERVATLAPVLRADAEKHLNELPKALQAEILSQLKATARRAAVTVQKQTQTTFPYLTDSRSEQVMEHFVQGLDRESQKVLAKANGYFQKELVRVHDVLGRFNVPPTAGIEKFEIERALIHELLLYVDDEMMAIGTSDELDVTTAHTK